MPLATVKSWPLPAIRVGVPVDVDGVVDVVPPAVRQCQPLVQDIFSMTLSPVALVSATLAAEVVVESPRPLSEPPPPLPPPPPPQAARITAHEK